MIAVLSLAMSGCAGERAFRSGNTLLKQGKVEPGLTQLENAARTDPQNKEYRIRLHRERAAALSQLLAQADAALALGKLDEAEAGYRRVLALDANNARAQTALENLTQDRRHLQQLEMAQSLFDKGDLDGAEAKLTAVLAENPRDRAARALQQRIEKKRIQDVSPSPRLKSIFKKPISMEFRDASLRAVFEVISRTARINFIFDKDVRPDLKATIFVKDTSIEDVIDLLLVTNQLAKRILNENTVLIYPNIPAKNRDYQALAVRSFYLANADVKQTLNLVKTIVKTRDVYVDEKLNLLVMRDTPEAIRLAERLISAQDLAEPEVLLEVEVLEISRTRLLDLGITPPTEATLTPLGLAPPAFTLADLTRINAERVGVSPLAATLRLRMENGDTNLLANPSIRVKNREKAKIHIGERVPVITTTVTSAGITSFLPETVNYLDVGLKLEVEPNISLDNEVAIKVGLEVSSLGQKTVTRNGSEVYRVGTRNAFTTLRIADGQTQILAGLINDEERNTVTGLPGLGNIPALGRLFANKSKAKGKTEIVLLITPHIVRNLPRQQSGALEFSAGTESAVGGSDLRLRSAAGGNPPSPAPALPQSEPAGVQQGTPAIPAPVPGSSMPQLPVPQSPVPASAAPGGTGTDPDADLGEQ